ncbi:MAG: HDOD domain-containing protein, partial [Verrucomicrobiota bacterium]
ESRVFQVRGFEKEVRQLFKHSLAGAGFAEEIARLRRFNVEEAFLAGLLHDIGKPVLYQTIADLEKERGADFPREAVEIVVQEFHAALGAEMVKKWALPERLAETIAYHHNPMEAPTSSQQAQLTRLASDFSHYLVGPLGMTEETLREHPMLAPLNLYEEEVEALFGKKEKVLQLVQAVS